MFSKKSSESLALKRTDFELLGEVGAGGGGVGMRRACGAKLTFFFGGNGGRCWREFRKLRRSWASGE